MDRTERFYRIDRLLKEQGVVPVSTLLDDLGVSLATFKRDLEYMRDRLNAPIAWDRDNGGYRYVQADPAAPAFVLPGLWFNAAEAHALLSMQQLLSGLEPGLLDGRLGPLQARLRALLDRGDHGADEVGRRIRVLHAAKRRVPTRFFEFAAAATLRRRRLRISHFNRRSGKESSRVVSPQQLVFYRDNWYLDAWCHLRGSIRSFAVDAITAAQLLDEPAIEVPAEELEAALAAGYGIFGGSEVAWAELRFAAERARWVAAEIWHPRQVGHFDDQGRYCLRVPYSDDRELIMDILKHGAQVEVLAPESLRARIAEELGRATALYP